MKIAHFSPLPPQQSGIADYCAELLSYLAQEMAVDAYTEEPAIPLDAVPIYPISQLWQQPARRYEYDLFLYHMGNHPTHQAVYACLTRYPGVVVLHEFNLHAFYAQQPAAYVREMGYARGLAGANEARRVLAGYEPAPVDVAPLFQRIADVSLGLIVHTPHAQQILRAITNRPVACIPHAVSIPSPSATGTPPDIITRAAPGTIILASFGYIAPSKRIDVVLQALAQLRGTVPEFRYILVGQPVSGYDVMSLVEELGLSDVVYQTGFVDPDIFERYLAHIDVGVNLRTGPTGGEMSGTLMRLLAHGRPAVVSNVGGFSTLPDDCLLKIDQDENEVVCLATGLRQLITRPGMRARYGKAARTYVATDCSFYSVARQYRDLIQACIASIV